MGDLGTPGRLRHAGDVVAGWEGRVVQGAGFQNDTFSASISGFQQAIPREQTATERSITRDRKCCSHFRTIVLGQMRNAHPILQLKYWAGVTLCTCVSPAVPYCLNQFGGEGFCTSASPSLSIVCCTKRMSTWTGSNGKGVRINQKGAFPIWNKISACTVCISIWWIGKQLHSRLKFPQKILTT